MIKDRKLAKHLLAVADDCSERINRTIWDVKNKCPENEFIGYRRAAGLVMGHIYTDIVAPIYRQHPDLAPDELRPKSPRHQE